ncbi:MAG TPA: ABC transporter ATP-binding protein [Bryobacteraceae bacterium]|nr:ABC transporter ATP-binding protein [Bryobacteraceae bacterium]
MNYPIRTHALTRRYGGTVALDGLDLEVPEGSIFGLVGPNGAGKTTAIKVLMNLQRPSSGRAEVLECDSVRLGPSHFAQIGYVSENQKLPGGMTVEGFMNYLRPFYPTWDDALADELIRQFDLPRTRKLRHLSHGMFMKAAMASSLAYRPKLIVLDEPFTGLDPLVRDELIEGLLPRTENTTVFISSHDLSEIESFASHIGFLDRGRLQFSEEMGSLAARFREVEVTLERPAAIPQQWPATWLNAQQSAAVIRFVDSQFEAERTMAEVERLFGGGLQVAVNPMPLRAIFVTLAKAGRKAAA